eukprot:scaffold24250_cov61-Attheya_sp.AAC.4
MDFPSVRELLTDGPSKQLKREEYLGLVRREWQWCSLDGAGSLTPPPVIKKLSLSSAAAHMHEKNSEGGAHLRNGLKSTIRSFMGYVIFYGIVEYSTRFPIRNITVGFTMAIAAV